MHSPRLVGIGRKLVWRFSTLQQVELGIEVDVDNKYLMGMGALLLLVAPLAVSEAHAEGVSPIPTVAEGFRFAVTPYLWTPGITGNVDYENVQRVHTHMDSNKVLSNLSIGAMLDGEVHYGNWGLMGNGVFAKLSNNGSKSYLKDQALTVDSSSDAWMGIYTVAGTYTAYASKSVYVDALAGVRFLNLNAKVSLDASVANTPYQYGKTLYSSVHASDAIAGVKGRFRLSESSWYVPFYLDAGGGSAISKFTSQQTLGIGYAFDAVDLSLVWNNVYYSLSNDKVSSYINMTGPAVAATFRF